MEKIYYKINISILIIIMLLSCNNSSEIVPTRISVDKTEITLVKGETSQITVSILPENATDKSVIWTTSDNTVATVSSSGLVTSLTTGTATIKAISLASSLTATSTVIVTSPNTGTGNDPINDSDTSSLKLVIGQNYQVYVNVLPVDATDKTVVWTTSDNTIASVSNTGLVTSLKRGSVTITATSNNGAFVKDFTIRCVVDVDTLFNNLKSDIEIQSSGELSYRVVTSEELAYTPPTVGTVTFEDKNSTNKAVSWNNPINYTMENNLMTKMINLFTEMANNTNLNSLLDTPFSFSESELPTAQKNKVVVTEDGIYLSGISIDDGTNPFFDTNCIIYFNHDNSSFNKMYMQMDILFNTYPGIVFGSISSYSSYNSSESNSVQLFKSLTNLDPVQYTTEFSKGKKLLTSDSAFVMQYTEDSKTQDIKMISNNGTITSHINSGTSNGEPCSFLQVEIFNSLKELISSVIEPSKTLGLDALDNNDIDQQIINASKEFSLYNALPLKSTYANDYSLISIKYPADSSPYKSYYLYKKTKADNSSRDVIPTYASQDIIDYIDSFIDTNIDIELNMPISTSSDHNIPSIFTTEPIYFEGSGISDTATITSEFSTKYQLHWSNFRNSVVDYTVQLPVEDKNILDSLK